MIADMVFLYKIINSLLNCSDLVELVTYNAPVRQMRKKPLFVHKPALYLSYTMDPINRAMQYANLQFDEVDPFIGPLSSFRARLFSHLNNNTVVN